MADAMGPPLRAHIRCAYSITLSSFLHPPRYPGEAKQDKHLCTRKWGPKIFMSNSNGLHRIKRGEEVEHGWLCNVHLWSLALIAGLFGGSVACSKTQKAKTPRPPDGPDPLWTKAGQQIIQSLLLSSYHSPPATHQTNDAPPRNC